MRALTLERIDQWGSLTVSTLLGLFAPNPTRAIGRLPLPLTIEHPGRPKNAEDAPSPTADQDEIRKFFDRLRR